MTANDRLLLRELRPLGGPPVDLLIAGGRIADIGTRLSDTGARHIDCGGLVALPGLVDLHTHLREPGGERSETIHTGALAAAAGGYGAVVAMANTDPVADRPEVTEAVRQAAAGAACTVLPAGSITRKLAGIELSDIPGLARSGVRMFSDDGRCVHDSKVMRAALDAVGAVGGTLAQHAEDHALTAGAQVNDGPVATATGLRGWPAEAEDSIIARDCVLAAAAGTALHICHVSTAGAVEVVRWAKQRGWPVTAEVTPHHLLLSEAEVLGGDPVYKVNPPLRRLEDVAALRAALVDGTIDAVATDHAPHHAADKAPPWCGARPGMLGLETALAVVAEIFVRSGQLDWAGVADRMSVRPARIARISARFGRPLDRGEPATLTLVGVEPWRVDPAASHSRSRNTPVAGRTFHHRPMLTVLEGRVTHDLLGTGVAV
ncbi:dihydroorotase [Nocardia sp. NPDC088792]|uniref:dihydroorotase n=1 Tax=Nocardia sp. NPDC088792 TaxID=3364332 RepID=UPI0037F51526